MGVQRGHVGSPTLRTAALALLVAAGLGSSPGAVFAGRPDVLIYYDGHMHTTRSDGSGSVADIKATALSRGLDAVVITDHCKYLTRESWTSLVAEAASASGGAFLVLPGFEVTGSEGMFNQDHINALGIDDPFVGDDAFELCPEEVWESPPNPGGTGAVYPQHLTKWVDYIHSNGGIAVHNHTSGSTRLAYGVKHIEIYNQSHVDDVIGYAKMLGYSDEEAFGLGITLNNFAIYGERDVNMPVSFPGFPDPIPLRIALFLATQAFSGVGQWLGSPEAPLSSWDDLLMAYVDGAVDTPVFGVANSDAHNTGSAASDVGVARNGVYARAFSAHEFLKALKAGRSFATTGPSLHLDVDGERMGDTAYIFDGSGSVNLRVNSEDATAILVQIDIIKNGRIWQTIHPMVPTYEAALLDDAVMEDGYYRIEVTSFDVVGGTSQFAWSNPVFVQVP